VRVVLALIVVGLTLVVVGCGGPEDATQRFAREATVSHLADDAAYDLGHVHCTGNPRPWLVERQTTESICAVRRANGGCDWYRVELVPVGSRVTAKVELQSENAGCIVP
jgi:hypothetical protein